MLELKRQLCFDKKYSVGKLHQSDETSRFI
ncbi:MAG: hypothetical protein CNLJKLNK_01344 [Holosporales bacterium]